MNTPARKHDTLSVPTPVPAPLSPQWAFVVQFRADSTGLVQEAGRVEHLVSGCSARFASLEELVAYLARALHQTNDTS